MPITYTYGADDAQPDVLEAGAYPATIKRATEGLSSNNNKMITVIWACDNGFNIFDHLVDLPSCRWKSHQLLQVTGNAPESGQPDILDEGEMAGWRANLKLVVKNGKNEIDGYEPAEEPTPAKPDPF